MKGFKVALLVGFSFVCYNANAAVSEEQQQWVEQAFSDLNRIMTVPRCFGSIHSKQ
jgi:hypothetical protein